MFMLNKLQKLLCFQRIPLSSQEVNFIMELNMGRNLKQNGNLYNLEYYKNPLKNHTTNELIEDGAFLLHYFRASEEVQKFLHWMFEAKSFYLDTLYFKGYTNFYTLLLKKIVS